MIDLPDDIQRMETNEKEQIRFFPKKYFKTKKTDLNLIRERLKKSKRPIIVIGNGVKISNTHKELKSFLKRTKIPYAVTWACHDLFNTNDNQNVEAGVYATRHGNFSYKILIFLLYLGQD